MAARELWSLPADTPRGWQSADKKWSQLEFRGLNLTAGNHPVMIEIEAKCGRFDIANVAWAAGDGFKAGREMEFIAGYPGAEYPTYRITIASGGRPITALRLRFPAQAEVDLRAVRILELNLLP